MAHISVCADPERRVGPEDHIVVFAGDALLVHRKLESTILQVIRGGGCSPQGRVVPLVPVRVLKGDSVSCRPRERYARESIRKFPLMNSHLTIPCSTVFTIMVSASPCISAMFYHVFTRLALWFTTLSIASVYCSAACISGKRKAAKIRLK